MAALSTANAAPPNVLFICVDDLRCSLGCYGDELAKTPNIDSFAAQSLVFRRHYVFCAACGPSRSTLLSGHRTMSWDYLAGLRQKVQRGEFPEPSEPVSLPHFFRQNGYRTVCIGKVSHQPGGVVDTAQQVHEMPFSWDRAFAPTGPWRTPWRAFFSYAKGEAYNAVVEEVRGEPPRLPYESADVDDEGYADGLNAAAAVEQLRELAEGNQPFFLAVGFYKPHLPFNAPQKYWDLYDRDAIPPAPWPRPPRHVSSALPLHDSYEPTTHYHWPSGRGQVSEEEGRILKHGYYAALSYVDSQIGKVLDEYQRLRLDTNTVVVLWSDHGWHLGDHGIWGKYTNYEWSLRSPLIIKTPQLSAVGEATDGIVETIDLYPTLADLCGLNAPDDLPGKSFTDLIRRPNQSGKTAALGMVWRGRGYVGAALRTNRYRLVKWLRRDSAVPVFVELYDHQADPLESVNIAGQQGELIQRLDSHLETLLGLPDSDTVTTTSESPSWLLVCLIAVACLSLLSWLVLLRKQREGQRDKGAEG